MYSAWPEEQRERVRSPTRRIRSGSIKIEDARGCPVPAPVLSENSIRPGILSCARDARFNGHSPFAL